MSDTPIKASDVPVAAPPDIAAAQQAIEADKQQRLQAFQQGLQALLMEYRVELYAVAQLTPDGRIVATPAARVET